MQRVEQGLQFIYIAVTAPFYYTGIVRLFLIKLNEKYCFTMLK